MNQSSRGGSGPFRSPSSSFVEQGSCRCVCHRDAGCAWPYHFTCVTGSTRPPGLPSRPSQRECRARRLRTRTSPGEIESPDSKSSVQGSPSPYWSCTVLHRARRASVTLSRADHPRANSYPTPPREGEPPTPITTRERADPRGRANLLMPVRQHVCGSERGRPSSVSAGGDQNRTDPSQ